MHRLGLWWLVRPGRGGCLFAGKLASPLRCLMLGIDLLSVGSCSLTLPKSVLLLDREVLVLIKH
jgi:hypothetical protein